MSNDNLVTFNNIEPQNLNFILNLPKQLLDNTYINPYSNINLKIPDGFGFLDNVLQNVKDSQTVPIEDEEVIDDERNKDIAVKFSNAPKDVLNRAVYVAKRLIEKGGFSKVQAAAIAGTTIDENKCNPASYMKAEAAGKGASGTRGSNRYGAGIGSWTGDYKLRVLQQSGYNPSTKIETLSMDQQIDMFIRDTQTGHKKYYDALRRCQSIEDASATSVLITGGVGKSKNWDTHPTQEDAKRLSDWYGASNDRRFGKSPYHWNLDKRRLDYSRQVLKYL